MNTVKKSHFQLKKDRLTRDQWILRKRELSAARKKQLEGIESQDIFKASIESKLLEAGAKSLCLENEWSWFKNYQRCGQETFYMMCQDCSRGHEASYQCCLKWCPRCNWRITSKRRGILEEMTRNMVNMKHVVLTQKNFDHLTREKIMESRKALFDLRRRSIFGKVSGGCASMEFTNERRGWHMHWHLLLASPFIDASRLAVEWGGLVGQEYAIVKVKEVGEKDYLQELLKYVVEGSELAKWTPSQILEFVTALQGTRLFTTFGKFREIAKLARALAEEKREGKHACECGCTQIIVGNDESHCQRIWNKCYGI